MAPPPKQRRRRMAFYRPSVRLANMSCQGHQTQAQPTQRSGTPTDDGHYSNFDEQVAAAYSDVFADATELQRMNAEALEHEKKKNDGKSHYANANVTVESIVEEEKEEATEVAASTATTSETTPTE